MVAATCGETVKGDKSIAVSQLGSTIVSPSVRRWPLPRAAKHAPQFGRATRPGTRGGFGRRVCAYSRASRVSGRISGRVIDQGEANDALKPESRRAPQPQHVAGADRARDRNRPSLRPAPSSIRAGGSFGCCDAPALVEAAVSLMKSELRPLSRTNERAGSFGSPKISWVTGGAVNVARWTLPDRRPPEVTHRHSLHHFESVESFFLAPCCPTSSWGRA